MRAAAEVCLCFAERMRIFVRMGLSWTSVPGALVDFIFYPSSPPSTPGTCESSSFPVFLRLWLDVVSFCLPGHFNVRLAGFAPLLPSVLSLG